MKAITRSLALGLLLPAVSIFSAFADNDPVGIPRAPTSGPLTLQQIEAKRLAQQEARRTASAEARRQAQINQRYTASSTQAENDKMKWACEVRARVADLMTLKYLRPRGGKYLVAFKVSGTGDVVDVIVQGEPQAAHRAEELLRATHMPVPPDGAMHTISTGVSFDGSPRTRSPFRNGCN